MAIETTFSDIRSGYSVSRSFYDAALKEQGRESFIAWIFNQISNWTYFSQTLKDLGTSERLLEALCHTSFEHENDALKVKSYERLEFLGDAVTEEHDERIGRAKDVAAAGVLLTALGATGIGLIVFLPYLLR